MNILGFDTCMGACSVAIAVGAGQAQPRIVRRFEAMDRGQAERLMPMIEDALRESGIGISEIDRIAVTHGPGTFTGTRISVAAARGFALSMGKPVVSFSSLEVLARNVVVPTGAARDLVIAVNANRGEAYVQVFDAVTKAAKSEPRLLAITECVSLSVEEPVFVAGTAATDIVAGFTGAGVSAICGPVAVQPDIYDSVITAADRVPLALPLKPLYLRPPDAKPQAGKSLARTV